MNELSQSITHFNETVVKYASKNDRNIIYVDLGNLTADQALEKLKEIRTQVRNKNE